MDLFTITEDVTPLDAVVTLTVEGVYTESRSFEHSGSRASYIQELESAAKELVAAYFEWAHETLNV